MRWNKTNKAKIWRIVTKFAFLPVRVDLPSNDTVVWLERYKVNQRVKQVEHIDGLSGYYTTE